MYRNDNGNLTVLAAWWAVMWPNSRAISASISIARGSPLIAFSSRREAFLLLCSARRVSAGSEMDTVTERLPSRIRFTVRKVGQGVPCLTATTGGAVFMAKPNYSQQKKQREQSAKKKRDEKKDKPTPKDD